jgi:hypothetical protein
MRGNTKSYTAGDSVAAETRLRLGKACHGWIVKSEKYFLPRIHRTAGHAFVLWFRDHVAATNQPKGLRAETCEKRKSASLGLFRPY